MDFHVINLCFKMMLEHSSYHRMLSIWPAFYC